MKKVILFIFLFMMAYYLPTLPDPDDYYEHYILQKGEYLHKPFYLETNESISCSWTIEVYYVGQGVAEIHPMVLNDSIYQNMTSLYMIDCTYCGHEYGTDLTVSSEFTFTAPYSDTWHVIFWNQNGDQEHLYLTIDRVEEEKQISGYTILVILGFLAISTAVLVRKVKSKSQY